MFYHWQRVQNVRCTYEWPRNRLVLSSCAQAKKEQDGFCVLVLTLAVSGMREGPGRLLEHTRILRTKPQGLRSLHTAEAQLKTPAR